MINSHRTHSYSLRRRFAQWFAVGVMLLSLPVSADPQIITVSGSRSDNPNSLYYYYTQMLTLLLEKTRVTDGDYVIAYHDHQGGIERDRLMLASGAGIDVMWASVTEERAQKLRVIDVDLLKGLNNYRALLIRKDAQPRFNQVKKLEDLKLLKAGSGPYWTDGLIMESNGFTVVYGANYAGLFRMLSAKRFDFLSRGLHEIGSDVISFKELNLIQERNLLLQYETPVRYCFFVNQQNEKLADRIMRGLNIAQADGSFDALFLQIPMFTHGYKILQGTQRRIFKVSNNTGH